MFRHGHCQLLLSLCLIAVKVLGDVFELRAEVFEEYVATYPYIALAFLDAAPAAMVLLARMERASLLVAEHEDIDVQFAWVNADTAEFKELVDVYNVELPGLRIFRNGLLYDFVGPIDRAEAIAAAVVSDSKPAVTPLRSVAALRCLLAPASASVAALATSDAAAIAADGGGGGGDASGGTRVNGCGAAEGAAAAATAAAGSLLPHIVGFFEEQDVVDGGEAAGGFSNDSQNFGYGAAAPTAWQSFCSAAEALRDVATFHAVTDPDVAAEIAAVLLGNGGGGSIAAQQQQRQQLQLPAVALLPADFAWPRQQRQPQQGQPPEAALQEAEAAGAAAGEAEQRGGEAPQQPEGAAAAAAAAAAYKAAAAEELEGGAGEGEAGSTRSAAVLWRAGGDFLSEDTLVDWVLAAGVAGVQRLSRASAAEELVSSRFFVSNNLKVIAFLRAGRAGESDLMALRAAAAAWQAAADAKADAQTKWDWEVAGGGGSGGGGGGRNANSGGSSGETEAVLFAHVSQGTFQEVWDFFGVPLEGNLLPAVVAHDRAAGRRYIMPFAARLDPSAIVYFVEKVSSGDLPPTPKSEAVPASAAADDEDSHGGGLTGGLTGRGVVRRVVGATAAAVAAQEGVDVLLVAHVPGCEACEELLPALAMLAKAFQAEPRVFIGSLDHSANDLPPSVTIASYPELLWFPAADKPYSDPQRPTVKRYAGEGLSLAELVTFVMDDSSFDVGSLLVASPEQLAALLEGESDLRAAAQLAEHFRRRNERRPRYDSRLLDWVAGEVVFDGTRWHTAVPLVAAAAGAAAGAAAAAVILPFRGAFLKRV